MHQQWLFSTDEQQSIGNLGINTGKQGTILNVVNLNHTTMPHMYGIQLPRLCHKPIAFQISHISVPITFQTIQK